MRIALNVYANVANLPLKCKKCPEYLHLNVFLPNLHRF